jgi:hypothetical protein
VPPLKRRDRPVTEGKEEQARELLATFFPPLPENIDDELAQEQHPPLDFVQLTMQEIEARVFEANS